MAFQTKNDLNAEKTISFKTPGESVEGYYLGSKTTKDTGYGPGTLHVFQTSKGNVACWGKTRLNSLLTAELVGQMVRATFTGMGNKVKGKNPAYLFKVEHDPAETLTGEALESATAAVSQSNEDYADDDISESDIDADDVQDIAPPPARAAAPRAPAQAPDPARAAKVQELLNRNRKQTA